MRQGGYREVFVFLAGSTPQVITETVCSLALKIPPVYPEELYIITTGRGKTIVNDALNEKGILNRLVKEYNLPPITIREESFVIPFDMQGSPLDDIRDEAGNEIMGDLITSLPT